jgi:hypothetical protein
MVLKGRSRTAEPQIDLETVRETISYIHGDLEGLERFAKVRAALGVALDELAILAGTPTVAEHQPQNSGVVELDAHRPRFVPWHPGG